MTSFFKALLPSVEGAYLSTRNKLWRVAVVVGASTLLTSCGFHLPNQIKLDNAMPEINVTGDYHAPFYKMVVNRLQANGVTVYAESSHFHPDLKRPIPYLMIPEPSVIDKTVSLDSRAQAIEHALYISIAATLNIPNHRPILMRNSITRSALNKPGDSLASDLEKATVIDETLQELANQVVLRLSYLGRYSDPDSAVPQPAELTLIPGSADEQSIIDSTTAQYEGLTLLEALQLQAQEEHAQGTTLTLDELKERSYKLPPVRPQRLHQSPRGF